MSAKELIERLNPASLRSWKRPQVEALYEALSALVVEGGPGVFVYQQPGGQLVSTVPRVATVGRPSRRPLEARLELVPVEDGSEGEVEWRLFIEPGTINGLVPWLGDDQLGVDHPGLVVASTAESSWTLVLRWGWTPGVIDLGSGEAFAMTASGSIAEDPVEEGRFWVRFEVVTRAEADFEDDNHNFRGDFWVTPEIDPATGEVTVTGEGAEMWHGWTWGEAPEAPTLPQPAEDLVSRHGNGTVAYLPAAAWVLFLGA